MKKSSWLPLAAALVLPVVIIIVVLKLSERVAEREGERPRPVAENVYVSVTLETAGEAQGREVTFLHDVRDPDTGSTTSVPHVVRTDAAGIATITLPKTGNVVISTPGANDKQYIDVLENRKATEFEFRMKVTE